jgi:predicted O-linked N-acetylglucosamine transferase (SPINDLY family)
MTVTINLSQCLLIQDGRVRLDVPDGVLPGFLIEAFNAVQIGRLDHAEALLNDSNLQVIERLEQGGHPATALAFLVLGMTSQRLNRLKTAAGWYERAAAREPHPLVWAELASIYDQLMLYGKALTAIQKTMSLDPGNPQWALRYPDHLAMAGHVTEAVDLLKARLEQGDIGPSSHSSLLMYLQYLPEVTGRQLLAEHLRWGRMHAPPSLAHPTHDRDPNPDRRLRVGYVSADFRQHSVAYAFEAVLDGRCPEALEVYGYGSVASPDSVTERLAGKFDRYYSIYDLDDTTVAEMIERDRIDILVDLAGHTSGNRLGVLAFKPAPIQVTYLGYPDTTGINQVDYRITDPWIDFPGSEAQYVEHSMSIQGGVHCYTPPSNVPPCEPGPVQGNGFITFGSFSNLLKINDYVVVLWCEVLKAVPRSRLVLKFPGSHDSTLVRSMMDRFSRYGIGVDRMSFLGYCREPGDHYACFHSVDIALDTYPYNGCLTTLEALWMGVPVVTLVGNRFASRAGLSLLAQLGLETFAARSPDEYVAKASVLASQVESLASLRSGLRHRMRASPLLDNRRFAGALEAAYRRMWRQWCVDQNPESRIQNSELTRRGGHGP